MAQGTQKLKKPAAKSAKKNSGITKKGARVFAPKRATLIATDKLTKKVTAQLTAGTERQLASKAGHLELLQGGKKDKKGSKEGKK
ncbi:hypothetical protein RUND412_001555 [Rhizina undulata]